MKNLILCWLIISIVSLSCFYLGMKKGCNDLVYNVKKLNGVTIAGHCPVDREK